MKPTRRAFGTFATAAALFVAGTALHEQTLLTLSGIAFIAPLLGALELSGRTRTTRHTLDYTEQRFSSPGPVSVNWNISPTRRTRFTAELDGNRGKRPALLFAGNDSQRERIDYHNQRRGYLRVGPITERHTDIFGCFVAKRQVATEAATIIWPQLWNIDLGGYRGRRPGPGPSRRKGMSGDIDKLRPYILGDDPRHIHWRTSARRGELHIVERYDDDLPELCVAVDTSGDVEVLDFVCSAAASLLSNAYENGISTVCSIAGNDQLNIGRKLSGLHQALDTLALTEYSATEPRIVNARTVIAVSTPHNADNLLAAGADIVISVGDSPLRASSQLVPWYLAQGFDQAWASHVEHADTATKRAL
jgi:uncharacterized protein (DUF58 family)